MRTALLVASSALLVTASSAPARADAVAPVTPAPPAPYSSPWQLRPAAPGTVFRWDSSTSFYEDKGGTATTVASTMLASYKLGHFAPLVRAAFVHNDPGAGATGNAFVNPFVGTLYGFQPTPELRMSACLGAALPIGQGGGKAAATDATAAAAAAGVYTRAAMDNALFAVNYLTIVSGVDVAYVAHGFTAQVEATVLQGTRVRNEAIDKDAARTNFTSGLHLGWFLLPALSLGTELRYQRWLSTPSFLAMAPERRETINGSFGVRGHFHPNGFWFRPGLAYTRGFDAPMKTRGDDIVQVDLLFAL